MKLSIIVPVYNMAGDNKLNYCLDSLMNQKLPPEDFEVIAVDDASTDDSPRILKEYEARYPNFRAILNRVNKRQGGAKNDGLKVATGDFVGFVDSDDFIHPEMFSRMLKKASEEGADLVGCQYSITYEQGPKIGRVVEVHNKNMEGSLSGDALKAFMLCPGSMVVKIYDRSVIKENALSFPEHTFYEDNMAAPLWVSCFKKFALVDEPLYYYYQHEQSTVHTISLERLKNRMDMAVSMLEHMRKRPCYERVRYEVELNFIRIYCVNTLFSHMQSSKRTDFKLLCELRKGMRTLVPEYFRNPYYESTFSEEHRNLLQKAMRSPLFFALYYRMLTAYRRLRYDRK